MLSSVFFRDLLPIMGSEIIAHFRKNNVTLRQNLPLVTSGDLNIDLSKKNVRNTFDCTCSEQSNAFFRALLSLLVFESEGVVILTPPPPPTTAKVAETATRARVKGKQLNIVGI